MKKTILLIEDDIATIEIYELALKRAGFEVETFRWGYEALNKINKIKEGKAKKPDLVILDLILPDMNGIQILEEIRKCKETKNLPVFILTNYSDSQLEKKGGELKTEQYILKTNCTPKELTEMIKRRLKILL